MKHEGKSSHRPSEAQRGAVALLVALLLIPIVGFVALAVDVSSHLQTRQRLWDTIDAAALAGATQLPDGAAARAAALAMTDANMDGLSPTIEFWCVVGADGSGGPRTSDIPINCNPGPGPYDAITYPGLRCNQDICSIPCDPFGPGDSCNTITVLADQTVPYRFAPVIGFQEGNTGTLSTSACRGACGRLVSSPADVALVVDRTGSMRNVDVIALKEASEAFLEQLTPTYHHVALGTLGSTATSPSPSCPTEPSASRTDGQWVAVGLRDDYDLTDSVPPDDPPDLNTTSQLVQGIDCLTNSSTGTNLGDPIFHTGSYLINNGRDVPKGMVFMTDGEANEPSAGSPCDYAQQQAQQVEDAGVVIITIAYRLQNVDCNGVPATTVLANMASDPAGGPASLDDGGDGPGGLSGGCQTQTEITSENNDNDHFFCAPQHTSLVLAFIQATEALTQELEKSSRLIRLPN